MQSLLCTLIAHTATVQRSDLVHFQGGCHWLAAALPHENGSSNALFRFLVLNLTFLFWEQKTAGLMMEDSLPCAGKGINIVRRAVYEDVNLYAMRRAPVRSLGKRGVVIYSS